MCSLDASSYFWTFLNTHQLCCDNASPWTLHMGAQYNILNEWILSITVYRITAFPAACSSTPFMRWIYFYFLCSLWGWKLFATTTVVACSLPFPAVVGNPALSTSCPHISCPLSRGNHLLCFLLLAAYTFGLFDHTLSSWGFKILLL